MNYFAHALPFLARSPDGLCESESKNKQKSDYLVVATGVPDMLSVVDRSVRLRRRQVEPYQNDPDPILAATACGVAQHLADDARFHRSEAFACLTLDLTIAIRDRLEETPSSLRPRFLSHLLVEVLLDAAFVARAPWRLEAYYTALESVDAQKIEDAVNRMAHRRTDRLAAMIETIPRIRFLSDYADDRRLWMRMNQVMDRADLDRLPEGPFCFLLPDARRKVAQAADALLAGIPVKIRDVRKIPSVRAG